jgi:hypothetical protein
MLPSTYPLSFLSFPLFFTVLSFDRRLQPLDFDQDDYPNDHEFTKTETAFNEKAGVGAGIGAGAGVGAAYYNQNYNSQHNPGETEWERRERERMDLVAGLDHDENDSGSGGHQQTMMAQPGEYVNPSAYPSYPPAATEGYGGYEGGNAAGYGAAYGDQYAGQPGGEVGLQRQGSGGSGSGGLQRGVSSGSAHGAYGNGEYQDVSSLLSLLLHFVRLTRGLTFGSLPSPSLLFLPLTGLRWSLCR